MIGRGMGRWVRRRARRLAAAIGRGLEAPLSRLRATTLPSTRGWAQRLVFWIGAVLVGLVAIGFAWAADQAAALCAAAQRASPLLMLVLAPAGLGLSLFLSRRYFPGSQGSGIPQAIAALHLERPASVDRVLSLRVACGKIVLTLLALACGASVGREGPTVQIGASMLHAFGRIAGMQIGAAQRALVLAGSAAGIAGAFNTPLAGVVFAIEELSHSFESRASGTVLTAVILSGITSLALIGDYTYFGTTAATLPFGAGWLAVLVCGVAGGASGGLFSRALIAASAGLPGMLGRFVRRRPVVFAMLCGLGLALIGLASHGSSYGTGYAQARSLVDGRSGLPGSYFALKFLATVLSYCSGIPGGIFAPSLAVGAGLGSWIAGLLPSLPSGAVVLLGMVAYFSGVVQAPITAAVIVMEMTDNQGLTVALMATSFLAFAVSRLVCPQALYGVLAQRMLRAIEPEETARNAPQTAPAIVSR